MIATKAEFLERSNSGRLGNYMPSWDSPREAIEDGHRGPVMIRSRQANSPHMRPDVPVEDADRVMDGLVEQGARREDLYLTWMSPAVGRRINAEVWRGPRGLYLNYSTDQTNVRAALEASGKHVEGAAAVEVLRWALDENSYEDVMDLLDLHPDAVVELTAFDRQIGAIPGRNGVIWEVRNY